VKSKWFFLLLCGLALFSTGTEWARPQVFVQPLGRVDSVVLEKLSASLASYFKVEVKTASGLALPASAYYPPRQRYRADKLLEFLDNLDIALKGQVVAVTEKDISVTKGAIFDWGIFGYGYTPGRACVVSTFRLKHGRAAQDLFLQRLERVALHELAHTFGLLHCSTAGCLMEDARGSIGTVDRSNGRFCSSCRRQLGALLKNR
jgi:archaemetzincin